MQQVFSGRMLNHKWTRSVRNAAVGDIVYLAEAENDDPVYRLGQIVEACPGEDGCVRTVRVQYTNPGKLEGGRSPPKITTRQIHKVAVIVPAGYTFKDDTEVGGVISGRKRGKEWQEPRGRIPPRRRKESLRKGERSPRSARDAGDPRSQRDQRQPRASLGQESRRPRRQQWRLRHFRRPGTSSPQ
jgi:hypothetical protein